MTKEEWEKFEEVMGWTHGAAILEADGLEIAFYRGEIKKNRLGIVVYINGKFDKAWMEPGSTAPESKAMRPVTRYLYPKKFRNLSRYKKHQAKKLGYDVDEKRSMFSPLWGSGSQIRRHFQNNFKEVKLVKLTGHQT